MSDPTPPPVDPTRNDPTRNDPTGSMPSGSSVPPAYETPAAPAYPSYPAPGTPAATAYGQNPYGQQNPQDKYNVLAIISLVSAFFISLVAVITGHMAMSQIKKTGEKGYGLALWGLILGYLGIVVGIIFAFIFIAILVSGAATSSSFNTL